MTWLIGLAVVLVEGRNQARIGGSIGAIVIEVASRPALHKHTINAHVGRPGHNIGVIPLFHVQRNGQRTLRVATVFDRPYLQLIPLNPIGSQIGAFSIVIDILRINVSAQAWPCGKRQEKQGHSRSQDDDPVLSQSCHGDTHTAIES